MGFVDLFEAAEDREPEPSPEFDYVVPDWSAPPDGELGVAVPLNLILGKSHKGVLAITHAIVYSNGLTFDLIAQVDGLKETQTHNFFFRMQHAGGQGDSDELPDEFVRLGVELPDGARASNIGLRRRWTTSSTAAQDEPDSPVFFPMGGGSGGGGRGSRHSWHYGYWLWPIPNEGTLRFFAEWPVAGIELTTSEVETRPIVEAASNPIRPWHDGEEPRDEDPSSQNQPVGATSMFTVSGATSKVPRREQPDGDATLTAAQRRYVRKSLQRAIEILDEL